MPYSINLINSTFQYWFPTVYIYSNSRTTKEKKSIMWKQTLLPQPLFSCPSSSLLSSENNKLKKAVLNKNISLKIFLREGNRGYFWPPTKRLWEASPLSLSVIVCRGPLGTSNGQLRTGGRNRRGAGIQKEERGERGREGRGGSG